MNNIKQDFLYLAIGVAGGTIIALFLLYSFIMFAFNSALKTPNAPRTVIAAERPAPTPKPKPSPTPEFYNEGDQVLVDILTWLVKYSQVVRDDKNRIALAVKCSIYNNAKDTENIPIPEIWDPQGNRYQPVFDVLPDSLEPGIAIQAADEYSFSVLYSLPLPATKPLPQYRLVITSYESFFPARREIYLDPRRLE